MRNLKNNQIGEFLLQLSIEVDKLVMITRFEVTVHNITHNQPVQRREMLQGICITVLLKKKKKNYNNKDNTNHKPEKS
jgi:hypothetical protein